MMISAKRPNRTDCSFNYDLIKYRKRPSYLLTRGVKRSEGSRADPTVENVLNNQSRARKSCILPKNV